MTKVKTYNNKTINKILKETSLETRLKVLNQMAFISLLSELGYRKNEKWKDSEDDLLQKLCSFANKHTKEQLKEIEQWEKDEAEFRLIDNFKKIKNKSKKI